MAKMLKKTDQETAGVEKLCNIYFNEKLFKLKPTYRL